MANPGADVSFIDQIKSASGQELEELLTTGYPNRNEVELEVMFFSIDLCVSNGLLDVAERYAADALEVGYWSPVSYEKAGYLELFRGNHDRAKANFEAGAELDPGHYPNQLGLFECAYLEGRYEDALEAANRILDWEGIYARDQFVKKLNTVADALYLQGQRAQLKNAYDYVDAAEGTPLTLLRKIDCMHKDGDHVGAYDELQRLGEETLADPWARCIAIEVLRDAGHVDKARELAATLFDMPEPHIHFVRTYLSCFSEDERADAALAAMTDVTGQPRDYPAGLEFMLTFRAGMIDQALLQLRDANPDDFRDLFYDILELAYKRMEAGALNDVGEITGLLEQINPSVFGLAMLMVNRHFLEQDWEAAAQVLERAEPSHHGEELELLLKRFELNCFTNNIEAADEIYAELRSMGTLPQSFLPPLLRFLAEKKDWDTLCEVVADEGIENLRFDQIGFVILRAYTKAGRLDELRDLIEMVPGWESLPDLCRLRVSVLDATSNTREDIDAALADPTVTANPIVRRRLELKRAIAPSLQRSDHPVVYFCTNTGYRCGSAVTVLSMLQNNPEIADAARVEIVTDEEDGLSAEVFAALGRELGCEISVVQVESFLRDFVKLDPAYGIFTSGYELSPSAYYRIFYAKHLHEQGDCGRALYFDSDIVIRGDLMALIDGDLAGQPLSARREIVRPEVVKAAEMHGMAAEDYFNSGVLALDMKHPEIGACLDRSIDAVIGDSDTLLFHDQCALNIGFKGKVNYLPIQYNFFAPPSITEADFDEEAKVLHFLDRPKPWEPEYDHWVGTDWLKAFEDFVPLIGRGLAGKLFWNR